MEIIRKIVIRWNRFYFKFLNKFYAFAVKIFPGTTDEMSPETINWAYRLFLDREPESPYVITDKLNRLKNSQDLRREFLTAEEFKIKNPDLYHLSLSGDEPPMFIEKSADITDLFTHIQHTWEHLGQTEPYWSVATFDDFKSNNIKDLKSKFYNSGLSNVDTLFKTLKRNNIDHRPLNTCLEYGCGLGRVTCWLAKRFEKVFGYDISLSHLKIARQYFDEIGLNNILLKHISNPKEIGNFPKVDVVYSVIVLQHNPPPVIRKIIIELIRALNPAGIAFFQVPTYRMGYRFCLREYLTYETGNREMEMHVLPQHEIFDIVRGEQGKIIEVLEDHWAGSIPGQRSNTFIIQKVP